MLALLLTLCLLPIPVAFAEEGGGGEGGDSGGGGTSVSNTYVTVNGGQNSLGSADSVDVTTSITNITADNVTVYVEGDYNPTYLYYPKVSELHMANNTNGAFWNPTTEELTNTLHAAVMKSAGIAILYDGWIDLENSGTPKPEGATREGEILGYDIYAKLGEKYVATEEVTTYDRLGNPVLTPVSYAYENGGVYTKGDKVNYTWAITQLYRAVGVEQVEYYVLTEGREPYEGEPSDKPTYDINSSPLAQFITMATKGVDLSAVISNVYATRTNPDTYLEMATKDCLGVVPAADRESQTLTIGEFCLLAYKLMDLYGEPVLTEKETYLLLEAYGQDLPYGLPEVQLEAIKYLLARGIIESDMNWRDDITFEDASTILMRIKDENSRLTFKEIQLTTDVELLSKGYYPTTVSTYQSPIEITDQFNGYDTYTTYDYFIEVVPNIQFQSANGNFSIPFIGAGYDNVDGVRAGTTYLGKVTVDHKQFYHFRVERNGIDTIGIDGRVYINTAKGTDAPARYSLPLPGSGNDGGYYIYNGSRDSEVTDTTSVDAWTWHSLDSGEVDFPAEYLDKARYEANMAEYDTQLGLFNEALYGFSFRVYKEDLGKVSFEDATGTKKTLEDVHGTVVPLKNEMSLRRLSSGTNSAYVAFEITGCSNKGTLAEIFQCDDGAAYQSYPAFAKQNNQYLVSIDYLKSIGAVWEFTKSSNSSYYLGIKTRTQESRRGENRVYMYTDVYIGTTSNSSYVIRGSQLTIYGQDTEIIVESDTGYYVDYSAVLGVSDLVGFDDDNGNKTLVLDKELEGVDLRRVANTNNQLAKNDVESEWSATVQMKSGDQTVPYVYCPVTYPLANWITVDDLVDSQQGVFTFFAKDPNEEGSPDWSVDGDVKLESMLGVQSPDAWSVSYTALPPISSIEATYDDTSGTYSVADGSLPDIAYIPQYNAFLIKPSLVGTDGFDTYGEFVDLDKGGVLSSLVYNTDAQYLGDWNYNWYLVDAGGEFTANKVVGVASSHERWYYDLAAYTGGSLPSVKEDFNREDWRPAPVGVPGLMGYGESMASSLRDNANVKTYSGAFYSSRNGKGLAWTTQENGAEDPEAKYSLIHATPTSTWIQSCGFTFTLMAGSKLGTTIPTAPGLTHGDATAGFDWEQFFHDVGLQNADDWLTIAIIAVLNILPRIFMFAFILLMGLSLIANVKPWQVFCDKIFDPYKLLTFGRKDVHTIQLKMVFLYSIIALALFGLFQNGIILEIIAWFARAVTGILSR